MQLYRKLTLKSAVVYAITFTAGVIVGWLVKPKEKIDYGHTVDALRYGIRDFEEASDSLVDTKPTVYDSSGDWGRLVWENPSLEDTQPIG